MQATASGGPAGLISDRYALHEVVGRGAMGEVWAGEDLLLGRTVAVKVMHEWLASDRTAHARFKREARSVASLNHPCIAAVYDTGEVPLTPSRPYLVMEYVDGQTLADHLCQSPPPLSEALAWTCGILEALDYAHAAGIVHRDIKPANVMITRNRQVKVMDFGIAQVVGGAETAITGASTILGTVAYMSPEQALGQTVGTRSDLYSAGCVLYELLTGRQPYAGETALAVAYHHVHEHPAPPSRLNPGVPPHVEAALLRALAKDPDDRFPSASDMREALLPPRGARTLDPGEVTTATLRHDLPPTIAEEAAGDPVTAPAPPARRRTRAVASAVALLAAGVAVMAATASHDPGAPETQPTGIATPSGGADSSSDRIPGGQASPSAPSSTDSRKVWVRVPSDLVGNSLADARARLARLGLRTTLTPGSMTGADGTVIATRPTGGAKVAVGTAVALTVSGASGAAGAATDGDAEPSSSASATASPSDSGTGSVGVPPPPPPPILP
ncbi:protein kinase [Streptomyces sp. SID5914]|nr:protein kinase [Streptomyces sp. SID5914]MZG15880.1 protein kinase [Streptomyces sp. SID5914]